MYSRFFFQKIYSRSILDFSRFLTPCLFLHNQAFYTRARARLGMKNELLAREDLLSALRHDHAHDRAFNLLQLSTKGRGFPPQTPDYSHKVLHDRDEGVSYPL